MVIFRKKSSVTKPRLGLVENVVNNSDILEIYSEPRPTVRNVRLLWANTQSLLDKLPESELILSINNYLALCLFEHWCNLPNQDLAVREGYNCITMLCRTNQIRGGFAIYLKNEIVFQVFDVSNLCCECHFEVVSAIININEKCILTSVYRIPDGDHRIFLDNLDKLLFSLLKYDLPIIVCGDFNIDVNDTVTFTLQFLNVFRSAACHYLNNEPTRGLACLDNSITSISRGFISTKVLRPPLSDHCTLDITRRNIIECNQFLANVDWNTVFANSYDDCVFDTCISYFLEGMDKCFPFRPYKVKRAPSTNIKT